MTFLFFFPETSSWNFMQIVSCWGNFHSVFREKKQIFQIVCWKFENFNQHAMCLRRYHNDVTSASVSSKHIFYMFYHEIQNMIRKTRR